ncbi:hypothetical protein BCR43DRAFT_559587 [Syncephalastrum racemosum]|uniref:Uncharacterized protein n=1 Tax=Syncephalastrum racemosum TaxID=13706 RepID=A0A1X2HT14_SYNRA|nr:hypothetical protein BCR43DRAFT_559587 [Syncephalastrum racemosum]
MTRAMDSEDMPPDYDQSFAKDDDDRESLSLFGSPLSRYNGRYSDDVYRSLVRESPPANFGTRTLQSEMSSIHPIMQSTPKLASTSTRSPHVHSPTMRQSKTTQNTSPRSYKQRQSPYKPSLDEYESVLPDNHDDIDNDDYNEKDNANTSLALVPTPPGDLRSRIAQGASMYHSHISSDKSSKSYELPSSPVLKTYYSSPLRSKIRDGSFRRLAHTPSPSEPRIRSPLTRLPSLRSTKEKEQEKGREEEEKQGEDEEQRNFYKDHVSPSSFLEMDLPNTPSAPERHPRRAIRSPAKHLLKDYQDDIEDDLLNRTSPKHRHSSPKQSTPKENSPKHRSPKHALSAQHASPKYVSPRRIVSHHSSPLKSTEGSPNFFRNRPLQNYSNESPPRLIPRLSPRASPQERSNFRYEQLQKLQQQTEETKTNGADPIPGHEPEHEPEPERESEVESEPEPEPEPGNVHEPVRPIEMGRKLSHQEPVEELAYSPPIPVHEPIHEDNDHMRDEENGDREIEEDHIEELSLSPPRSPPLPESSRVPSYMRSTASYTSRFTAREQPGALFTPVQKPYQPPLTQPDHLHSHYQRQRHQPTRQPHQPRHPRHGQAERVVKDLPPPPPASQPTEHHRSLPSYMRSTESYKGRVRDPVERVRSGRITKPSSRSSHGSSRFRSSTRINAMDEIKNELDENDSYVPLAARIKMFERGLGNGIKPAPQLKDTQQKIASTHAPHQLTRPRSPKFHTRERPLIQRTQDDAHHRSHEREGGSAKRAHVQAAIGHGQEVENVAEQQPEHQQQQRQQHQQRRKHKIRSSQPFKFATDDRIRHRRQVFQAKLKLWKDKEQQDRRSLTRTEAGRVRKRRV